MYFEYGLDVYLFLMATEGLSSRAHILIECVSAVIVFTTDVSVFIQLFIAI